MFVGPALVLAVMSVCDQDRAPGVDSWPQLAPARGGPGPALVVALAEVVATTRGSIILSVRDASSARTLSGIPVGLTAD